MNMHYFRMFSHTLTHLLFTIIALHTLTHLFLLPVRSQKHPMLYYFHYRGTKSQNFSDFPMVTGDTAGNGES